MSRSSTISFPSMFLCLGTQISKMLPAHPRDLICSLQEWPSFCTMAPSEPWHIYMTEHWGIIGTYFLRNDERAVVTVNGATRRKTPYRCIFAWLPFRWSEESRFFFLRGSCLVSLLMNFCFRKAVTACMKSRKTYTADIECYGKVRQHRGAPLRAAIGFECHAIGVCWRYW